MYLWYCRSTGRNTYRNKMLSIWRGSKFPSLHSERSCRSAGVWSTQWSACHLYARTLPLLWGISYLQGRFWSYYKLIFYNISTLCVLFHT